jgi:hypothetical protein
MGELSNFDDILESRISEGMQINHSLALSEHRKARPGPTKPSAVKNKGKKRKRRKRRWKQKEGKQKAHGKERTGEEGG